MAEDSKTGMIRYNDSKTFLQIAFESFFTNGGSSCTYYDSQNWQILYNYGIDSAIMSATYPTIERLSKEINVPKDILEKWKEKAEEEYTFGKHQNECFMEFMRKANEENVSFVVFKGPVIANLYKDPALRISSDTDIYVEIENQLDVLNFLERHDYRLDPNRSNSQVPVYENTKNGHRVEVHYSLWEEHFGPRIKLIEEMNITNPEHFIQIPVGDTFVTTFGHQEHLLYQMFHFIKHLMVEGNEFRTLVDLCFFINRYGSEINFDLFWKQMDTLGFTKACETILSAAVRYLHMKRDIMQDRLTFDITDDTYLLLNYSNNATSSYDEAAFLDYCAFMDPYVGGSEDTEKEKQLLQNIDQLGENGVMYFFRIQLLHRLHLTNREKQLPPIAPLAPDVFLSQEQITEAKQHAKHYFRAYGLTIASEIDMYELFPLDVSNMDTKDIDVYIHFSPRPDSLNHPDTRKISENYFWFQSVECRYVIRNGNEIILEKTDEAIDDKEIKPFIISHCLVYLLYMRGIPTIHSSTVALDEAAITIMGDCGAGKSTYSSLLRHEGYKLVADDITAITIENGIPVAQLSVPQQKYTVDTAEKEGFSLSDLECVDEVRQKYRLLLTDEQMYPHPVPMKAIFAIFPDSEDNLEIIKLEGMEALQIISRNLFNQGYSNNLGGLSVETFQTVLALATQVPIYKVLRPTKRDARQEILDFMLQSVKK